MAFLLTGVIVFQIAAAFLALRLTRFTGRNPAWVLIALALLLMAFRRAVALWQVLQGDASTGLDAAEELAGLVVSALMVAGMAWIAPVFRAMKGSEEQLAGSALKFRTVADFTHDWEYWIAPDGSLNYVSPSCERITGYRAEEFHADAGLLTRILHEEDRGRLGNCLSQPDSREVCSLDFRILTRSGELCWIGHQSRPVFDGDGRWIGRRVSNRDITRRIETEDRLRLEAERVAMLLKLHEQAAQLTDRELHDCALEQAVLLTGSELGFLYLVSEDQATTQLTVWRRRAPGAPAGGPAEPCAAEPAGLWVASVRLRRPASFAEFPDSAVGSGLPEGLPVLRGFLGVPILEGDKVRFLLGVGNKETGYGDYDAVGLRLVANELQKLLSQRRTERALLESQEHLRLKLDSILSPEVAVGEQELANILDVPAIQSLMEDFTAVTGMGTALLDLRGKVLVATGWQEICTRFHRVHPETASNCTESDLYLVRNVRPGEHVAYKCKNQLWDVVTPLFLGGKHVGNIYTGQFFYEDENVEPTPFIAQAERYGFDREAYLAALGRVPRLSREHVNAGMEFLSKFAELVSKLSYGNIRVAQAMSEQKRVDEELRRLNTELERRVAERTREVTAVNKELEAFAYSVSHDLRAPLRGIDGWSLALLEDHGEALNEEARGYLGRVRAEAQQMGRLIDDLLKLSRVTRSEMRKTSVDLSALVEMIAGRLREASPERQLEFCIEPGLTDWGDGSLLEIALSNLLENAVKFTGKQVQARIEFGRAEVSGKPVYFVRDNGAGFDSSSARNLFGPFQRMHRTSDFPGTGIGLATVRRIVDRHGGRIWAESRTGRGATFSFTLQEGT